MSETTEHRLEGFEPDNPLAFLALLGLLRSLDAVDATREVDDRVRPRAAWSIDRPPLRPVLHVARALTPDAIADAAARGIDLLAASHDFGGRADLNFTREECRTLLMQALGDAGIEARQRADILAALTTDAAVKDEKTNVIQATPFCLIFGQGHQHFLKRLAEVGVEAAPPARGKGRSRTTITAAQCIGEALFQAWHRTDPTTLSFRWDPEEDVRWALMAGDPTDAAYKTGTQHGANRLAAVGLAALTVVPVQQGGRIRANVIGGEFRRGFSFAWPIWRAPASLAAIRAMLAHPDLRTPGGLDHLGVEHVYVARRISVGKFMNFARARPLLVAEMSTVEAAESEVAA